MALYEIHAARSAAINGGLEPISPARPASAPTREASLFGEAYVRETVAKNAEGSGTYSREAARGALANETAAQDTDKLSESDEALLKKLQARDAKVRAHEAQHVMAAGGQTVGSPTYTYQTGPDGKRYAIGGSVNISILTTGDAESDSRQAKTAMRAAMATGEPSARDMQTAMRASGRAAQAQQKALEQYMQPDEDVTPGTSIIV